MKQLILLLIIISFGSCTTNTTSSAIPFLWNDEPDESSDQIMVITTMSGDELIHALTIHVESLGFVIESISEDQMITEPSEVEDNLMRLTISIDNNVVIITGDQGELMNEEVEWERVERGQEEGYSTPEWEIMTVLANSIDNTSILYN